MVNIAHVICPVDLSAHSARALRHAAAWARWYGASLRVLHVAPFPQALADLSGLLAALPARPPDEIRTEVERFAAETLGDACTPAVDILQGHPVSAILGESVRQPRSLLVMGTHGWTGLDRLLIGSVTERVAHGTTCPLLVVPPHESPEAGTDPSFGEVLCAVDFGPSSLAGLRYAVSLAQQTQARLDVVTVIEPLRDGEATAVLRSGVPEFEQARRARLLQMLHEHVPEEARLRCDTHEDVLTGRPADALLRRADTLHAGLVVIGTGDRVHLHALWFGSTTGRLMRAAHCPVLIVPGSERVTLEQPDAAWEGSPPPLAVSAARCDADSAAVRR